MYTLAIETSTDLGTIALSCDDKLLGEIELPDKRNHSKLLVSTIEEILKQYNIDKNAIDVCAVAKGPGSFTGIRIGVTTAKTLAWALGWQVAGVDCLLIRAQAMLETIDTKYDYLCPTMNALNDEYFYAIYDKDLNVISEPQLISVNDFNNLKLLDNTFVFDDSLIQPRSLHICKLVDRFNDLTSDDVHGLSPLYLKKSAAERHHDALDKANKL